MNGRAHGLRLPCLALLGCLALAAAAPAQQDKAFEQAKAMRRSGQAGAAADLLGQALQRQGGDERLAGLRGLCLLDAERLAEARKLAQGFAGYAGHEPRVHTLLGRIAQADGDATAALADFRAAVAAEPAFVEAFVGIIRVELSTGQFAAAAEEAEHLEALQPELGRSLGADALVAQAQKFRRAGEEQVGHAVEKYQAALQKRPGDRTIVRPLLECLIASIHIEPARALAAATFTDEADAAERHYYEGRCRDMLTDAAGARTEYLAALAADARYGPALLELARLAIEDGEFQEARERLTAAASAAPVTARSCLLLGLAEEGLGHDEAAETALRESVRLDAGNGKALYRLGRLLVRTGRDAEGEALLAKVDTGPK